MEKYILVLITAGSLKEGEKIGASLVEGGLAACCNIIPEIKSIFAWKGEIRKEREVLLLVKSKASLLKEVEAQVKKVHSYEVPEIIAFPIEAGLQDYFKWMDEVLKKKKIKGSGLHT
ncbi:MAG: divalent-cation tolerance protein CutA [Deltaproteobacteria bacterium]|nr:divalent-cation tolerance protein CutA [Deltaproteobacteria bacterium]